MQRESNKHSQCINKMESVIKVDLYRGKLYQDAEINFYKWCGSILWHHNGVDIFGLT